jgi:hypothetical protein
MNDKFKRIRAIEAIMAYRGCFIRQANEILERDDWNDVASAYKSGYADGLEDVAIDVLAWRTEVFGDASDSDSD